MRKKPGGIYEASLIDDDWPEFEQVVERSERRTLSVLSLILIFAALGADGVGKAQIRPGSISYGKSYDHTRRAVEFAEFGMDDLAIAELDQAATLEKDAHLKWHRSGRFALAGVVLFVLAFGCFGISRCVGERASSFLFLVLSIAYIISSFFLMI